MHFLNHVLPRCEDGLHLFVLPAHNEARYLEKKQSPALSRRAPWQEGCPAKNVKKHGHRLPGQDFWKGQDFDLRP